MTSSIILNQETPDERQRGLACKSYLNPVILQVHPSRVTNSVGTVNQ